MGANLGAVVLLESAKKKAAAGVDFSPRFGALCPCCGERLKVNRTFPWSDGFRARYHLCKNVRRCLLASAEINVKSLEVDPVGRGEWDQ